MAVGGLMIVLVIVLVVVVVGVGGPQRFEVDLVSDSQQSRLRAAAAEQGQHPVIAERAAVTDDLVRGGDLDDVTCGRIVMVWRGYNRKTPVTCGLLAVVLAYTFVT